MILNTNNRNINSSQSHIDHPKKNLGIMLVFGASLLSGLSAALTQRAMTSSTAGAKRNNQRNVFVLSAEMALYGIIFLLVNLVFNNDIQEGGSLVSNWTFLTLIPVLSNVSHHHQPYVANFFLARY